MARDRTPKGEDGFAHRSRTGAGWGLLRSSSKQGCEAHVLSPRWAGAALAPYSGVGTRSAASGDESKGPRCTSPQGPLPSREDLSTPRSCTAFRVSTLEDARRLPQQPPPTANPPHWAREGGR